MVPSALSLSPPRKDRNVSKKASLPRCTNAQPRFTCKGCGSANVEIAVPAYFNANSDMRRPTFVAWLGLVDHAVCPDCHLAGSYSTVVNDAQQSPLIRDNPATAEEPDLAS
jgi:hypothetical protein